MRYSIKIRTVTNESHIADIFVSTNRQFNFTLVMHNGVIVNADGFENVETAMKTIAAIAQTLGG